MKKLATIAKQFVGKNPQVQAIVDDNKGASYKALEPYITQRVVTKIGRNNDQFINRNALIWALIDACSEEDEDFNY